MTPLRTTVSTASTFRGEAPTTASERGKSSVRTSHTGHVSLRLSAPIESGAPCAREAHRDPLARRRRVPARQQRGLRHVPRGVPRRVALEQALDGRERRRGTSSSRGWRSTSGASFGSRTTWVVASCRLERIGTSSVTLREEIRAEEGWLAAEIRGGPRRARSRVRRVAAADRCRACGARTR